MKTSEIRQKFLSFFESKGHHIVSSASLVPGNDPTLLFTNAGMVQFKDVFTGKETRPYNRATSSQRCVRAGGKHNDLENVGYTARHHTFFEMLGNFSFGDYFKQDAIRYAWELLTTVYKLPAEKLWVTVYQEDDEAYDIWASEIGVPKERIIRIGDKGGVRYNSDNFWQMADTGPCGPCSEIFYDHGADVWGGPPGSPEEDGDRYIEVWNLVFMQFERSADGTMTPLPKPCVDTGMGLERISAVLQHVHSNYEIDLFQSLIQAAARETKTSDLSNNSLKVIADHIRACSFLIIDGVIPSNEGRGYVLRRIIRRALRHGHKLGQKGLFFYRLVQDLGLTMGEAYPELISQRERIEQVLRQEEERFSETLENGMRILEGALANLPENAKLDGQTLFTLYDTYGFPVDLTADICRERGIEVDLDGFEVAMENQRQMARASGKFKTSEGLSYSGVQTRFDGYTTLEGSGTVTALYVDGTSVQSVAQGQQAVVVLDATPFYAESGGQVGDAGILSDAKGLSFEVQDTQKISNQVFGHQGVLNAGTLTVGQTVQAQVDTERRERVIRNHSATHLMHKALRQVLGGHVQQRGSLVDAEKTRFDFAHDAAMTAEQIAQVEAIVNDQVLANQAVQAQLMSFDDAVSGGAMALFGEKYGDEVRVLDIGFSRELCGGTHVQRTGDIGLFKIVSEGGVAAGVRRVEAITGTNSLHWVQAQERLLNDASASLRTQPEGLVARISALQGQIKDLEREREQMQSKLAASAGQDLLAQAVPLNDSSRLLVATLQGVEAKALREMADQLKNKLQSAVILLSIVADGKVSLVAGVTPDLTSKVKAGDLVGFVASQMGGKGGGRPDMAMGGGTDASVLPQANASVQAWVQSKLGA
ncbi:alanine--tRNA ligase [Alcaligenes faecalis]|uniref:alanine--tRNA ligase n=1 Tax=Alcaligenes TaxID=507 RepID=UPI0005AB4F7D|nr:MULTISPECIES: alanine--tRNA ligase [Alcaligenes]ARP54123.1 alanyl-tRNA ligase [Alcaligenes faecalis]ATI00101.1 alanine--tRNA ligase [Alcaligenes faecalis]AYZ92887.1 alanine--tRNA ligase [Alcaligenes faecalis]MBH0309626.1 alanine--tRNA ligase [Alcaligenes faecalis]MCX5593659.1 alanine--tRNA ligase [Alcaligenes faecalis]